MRVFVLVMFFSFAALTFLPGADRGNSHVVQKGETLYSISRRYGLSVDDLCAINRITSASVLKAGQTLQVEAAPSSGPEIYTVQKGDTLYSIAKAQGLSVDQLRAINGLSSLAVLKAGQVLRFPASSTVTSTPSPSTTVTSAATPGAARLQWPIPGATVTYVTGKISGVQLASPGTSRVSSVSSGTVIYSGDYRGFGTVVFVRHTNGHVYVYANLANAAVQNGDKVTPGAEIGSTGPALPLTFRVYKNGKPIDPAGAPRV
jgi:murein DD-endopeptidase MepM/ murein hydrolase activator NlpD